MRRMNPVILVHGWKFSGTKMESMASYLRKAGWEATTPTLAPSRGEVPVKELARQLADFIKTQYGKRIANGEKIDLVGFSMGGLVCRALVQQLGGSSYTQRLVTISSPHHGTAMARLSARVGSRDMRPDSAFLRDLNSDLSLLTVIAFTSLWTPFDLMILPATSSRMPIGRERKLLVAAHPLMVWQSKCWRAVAEELRR